MRCTWKAILFSFLLFTKTISSFLHWNLMTECTEWKIGAFLWEWSMRRSEDCSFFTFPDIGVENQRPASFNKNNKRRDIEINEHSIEHDGLLVATASEHLDQFFSWKDLGYLHCPQLLKLLLVYWTKKMVKVRIRATVFDLSPNEFHKSCREPKRVESEANKNSGGSPGFLTCEEQAQTGLSRGPRTKAKNQFCETQSCVKAW